MGLGTERHDTMSQETHAAQWLGFRQPVLRVAREKRGETVNGDLRSEPRRSVGRKRVLGGAHAGGSIPTDRSASGSTSNRRTVPASR